MKYLTKIVLLSIVFVAAITPAHAFTVDLDGTNATGISNLDIGGTAYDVTFEFSVAGGTDDDPFPVACGAVPCDVFFGSEADAITAVTAINTAFNDNTTVPTTVGSSAALSFFVPYETTQGGTNINAAQGTPIGPNWGYIGAALDDTDSIEYARFSPAAAIPIPPAAWLFGSALAILGWVRRRTSSALPTVE